MKRKGQVVRRKRVQKMCMPQCDEEKGITGKGQFGEEKEKRAEKGKSCIRGSEVSGQGSLQ